MDRVLRAGKPVGVVSINNRQEDVEEGDEDDGNVEDDTIAVKLEDPALGGTRGAAEVSDGHDDGENEDCSFGDHE